MLGLAALVGLAVAVLVVANREPVQGQADDAQSDAPERAEQREGYEERLAPASNATRARSLPKQQMAHTSPQMYDLNGLMHIYA